MKAPAVFLVSCLLSLLAFMGCNKLEKEMDQDTAAPVEPLARLVVPMINEASGIADSKTMPGHLWVQEDSGNPAQLQLLSHSGAVIKKIPLKGIQNRDWEDMALFEGQLYLADIGDNRKTASEYVIYRFPEPTLTTDTIRNVSPIRFRYPDGQHDAEAFLLDPATKNILIITKQDSLSRVYKLTYPFSSTPQVAERLGNLPYPYVVSAALSADGKEAIVKTYAALYLYRRKGSESLENFLFQDYKELPYTIEPLGEAVSFAADGSGYFTLSEKGLASAVQLYFYKR
jgi:hypothetical protein